MTAFSNLDQKYGFPQGTMASLIHQESRGDVNACSPVGARGLCQFMPGTRSDMIKRHGLDPWSHNVAEAAEAGAIYLAELTHRFGGDLHKGLAAYNAGPGNVLKAIARGGSDWLSHLTAETRNYVPQIASRIGGGIAHGAEDLFSAGRRLFGLGVEEDDERRRRPSLASGFVPQERSDATASMNQFEQMVSLVLVGLITQAFQSYTPGASSAHTADATSPVPPLVPHPRGTTPTARQA